MPIIELGAIIPIDDVGTIPIPEDAAILICGVTLLPAKWAYLGSDSRFSSREISSSGCINLDVKPEAESGFLTCAAPLMVAPPEVDGDDVTAAADGNVGLGGPDRGGAIGEDMEGEDAAVDEATADGKSGLDGADIGGPDIGGIEGPAIFCIPGPPMNGRGGIGPIPGPIIGPIGPMGPMPGLMPMCPIPIGGIGGIPGPIKPIGAGIGGACIPFIED